MSAEYDFEAVRGLPGQLPSGEHILWQGAPSWRAFARQVLRLRAIGLYFALLVIWRGSVTLADGGSLGGALLDSLLFLPIVAAGLGLLMAYAWLVQRTTVYTITNKRVVLRVGIALTKAFNIPFTVIESVDLETSKNGTGSLALKLSGPDRVAYLHIWPHARPWRLARTEPSLRAIPKVQEVGALLAGALQAESAAAPKVKRVATAIAVPGEHEEVYGKAWSDKYPETLPEGMKEAV